MAITIKIVKGNKHSEFREKEELEFLKEILGGDAAERYLKGFQYYKDMTLEIMGDALVGSAAIEVQGGSFRVRELVIKEPYDNENTLSDAFGAIEGMARKNGYHKMWLIDHPRLGRMGFYRKNGWTEEAELKNNILGEDEYLMCKFIEDRDSKPKRTGLAARVVDGSLHSGFRKKEQLNLLRRTIGDKGQKYFEGFQKKELMTLEIRDGNKLIGSAGIEITDGLFRIRAFVLKKEYRGRGIGTNALRKMEEAAKGRGCHKLWLITNQQLRVVQLYKRLGWQIEGRLKNNVAKQDELLMSKYI